MLSTLFTNLREHIITTEGVNFTEDLVPFDNIGKLRSSENLLFFSSFQKLLDFNDSADFAKETGKARTCKKGYPCGSSCIRAGYNCKKGLAGQAKTYAEFLSLQSKQPKKSVQKPLDKKDKTQDTGKNKGTRKKQGETEMLLNDKELEIVDLLFVKQITQNASDVNNYKKESLRNLDYYPEDALRPLYRSDEYRKAAKKDFDQITKESGLSEDQKNELFDLHMKALLSGDAKDVSRLAGTSYKYGADEINGLVIGSLGLKDPEIRKLLVNEIAKLKYKENTKGNRDVIK